MTPCDDVFRRFIDPAWVFGDLCFELLRLDEGVYLTPNSKFLRLADRLVNESGLRNTDAHNLAKSLIYREAMKRCVGKA